MSDARPALTGLIRQGMLDAELGALLWLMAEHGLPLVVAAPDAAQGQPLRNAIADLVPAGQQLGDSRLAGGVVIGGSLEDVLAKFGGRPGLELGDEMRDLGVVVVVGDGRVATAHYLRPVERDGAGHLQRRPPALLAASTESGLDHFAWSINDELADRCGMERAPFEDARASRAALLVSVAAAGIDDAAAIRHQLDRLALAGSN